MRILEVGKKLIYKIINQKNNFSQISLWNDLFEKHESKIVKYFYKFSSQSIHLPLRNLYGGPISLH